MSHQQPQGYPSSTGAPQGYPPQGYAPASLGKATAAMWLGIVGLLCTITAPVGLFLGLSASKQIKAEPGRYANGGHATAGIVCGAIGTAFLVIGIAIVASGAAAGVEAYKAQAQLIQERAEAESDFDGVRDQLAAAAEVSVITVSANDLISEYDGNELRADAKFKGKIIETTGKVGDIKKDVLGNIYVTVGSGDEYEIRQVQCFVDDENQATVMNLSPGNQVTVRGRVDGLMLNVMVKDCVIVQ